MTGDLAPTGRPFSQIYVERGSAERDSARLRRRLGTFLSSYNESSLIASVLNQEFGTRFSPYDVEDCLAKLSLADFLDAITHLFVAFRRRGEMGAARWLAFSRRAFAEENVAYTIDNRAGVHHFVDEEFAANNAATLTSMSNERYAAARAAFESALRSLRAEADARQAIRSTFDACETVFKLISHRSPRLTASELIQWRKKLPRLAETEERSRAQLLSGITGWIEAAHWYRHAQGTEDVQQPSILHAVMMVSIGASFLRWLVEVDRNIES